MALRYWSFARSAYFMAASKLVLSAEVALGHVTCEVVRPTQPVDREAKTASPTRAILLKELIDFSPKPLRISQSTAGPEAVNEYDPEFSFGCSAGHSLCTASLDFVGRWLLLCNRP